MRFAFKAHLGPDHLQLDRQGSRERLRSRRRARVQTGHNACPIELRLKRFRDPTGEIKHPTLGKGVSPFWSTLRSTHGECPA